MKGKRTRRRFLEAGTAGTLTGIAGPPSIGSAVAKESPPKPVSYALNFEDYATIEAYSNGVPVYSLGNIAYIYGVSPDVYTGVIMQDGNTQPLEKIKPKKSWEIKNNTYGAFMEEPGPRMPWNDSQPMLP